MGDRITVMLLSENQGDVRQYNLNRRFVIGLVCALILFIAVVIGAGLRYGVQSYRIDQMAALHREKAHLESRLIRAQGRLLRAREKMVALTDVDRQIRTLTNMPEPGPEARQLGVGGGDLTLEMNPRLSSTASNRLAQVHRDLDQLAREARFLHTSFDTLSARLRNADALRRHLPTILPLPVGSTHYRASGYGFRTDPFTGRREFHNGLDIAGPLGTEVLATANGMVEKVAHDRRLGNYIALDHGNGIRTVYGHLKSLPTRRPKERVTRGDKIGNLGTTGRSTAPHVHYSIFKDGRPVDPRNHILNTHLAASPL